MDVDESNLCFVDVETTGLDPERHVVWEVAFIVDGTRHEYVLELTAQERSRADPMALKLTNFYERSKEPEQHWIRGRDWGWVAVEYRRAWALRTAEIIGDRHLVGNVVSFDARFLGDFLRRHGAPPIWHYHLIDIESMAAGHLGWDPPWKSTDLSEAIGVDPEEYPRHTALGDARWARAEYRALKELRAHGQS